MRTPLTNTLFSTVMILVLSTLTTTLVFTTSAHAIAINQCIRIIRDPQVGRETIVNVCNRCITAKLQRRRPGSASGVPNMREFNLPPRSQLLLPFRGPGQTRLTSEQPCPAAAR